MFKKSQIAVETLFTLGIVILLFLSIISIYFYKNREFEQAEVYLDKRNECFRFANLVKHVYNSGEGTEVELGTNFAVSVYGSELTKTGGTIIIEDVASVTGGDASSKAAILATESGPTLKFFYEDIKADPKFNPVWYHSCVSNLPKSGPSELCEQRNTINGLPSLDDAEWAEIQNAHQPRPPEINNTISYLIEELNNYNTIYLEDPTLNIYPMTLNQISAIGDWVALGNNLVVSEHFRCFFDENLKGAPRSVTVGQDKCWKENDGSDGWLDGTRLKWYIYGRKVQQQTDNEDITIQKFIEDESTWLRYKFSEGDHFTIEENNYLDGFIKDIKCAPEKLAAIKIGEPSKPCTFSLSKDELEQSKSIGLIYEPDGLSSGEGLVSINDNPPRKLTVNSNSEMITPILLSQVRQGSNKLSFSVNPGVGGQYSIEKIRIRLYNVNVIATFDESFMPAIAFWDYPDENGGRVYYYSDFEVIIKPGEEAILRKYINSIKSLVAALSIVVTPRGGGDYYSCNVPDIVQTSDILTGPIKIRNLGQKVELQY